MRCPSVGGFPSIGTGRPTVCRGILYGTKKGQILYVKGSQRLVAQRAESYPGKKEEDKPDKDWVAKFFEGSDEDEPQWEQEPAPSIKDKLIDVLERENERSKFWGRLAIVALGAVLLSERLSGKGIVTALNMATGVPIWEIEPALGLLVGAILAVGLYPAIRRREKPENPPASKLDSFQLVAGRVACVALAGTILAEATTGKGILALLNINTGVEITEIEGGLTFFLLLLFTADSSEHKEEQKK